MWAVPESRSISRTTAVEAEKLKLVSEGCDPKSVSTSIPVFSTSLCITCYTIYD